MLGILTLLLPLISGVLGKIIPDAGQAAQVNAELQKALIEQQGEIDKAIAEAAKSQNEVNLAEAQSPSIFVSGWRPAVGWCCAAGFTYATILQPILGWFAAMAGITTPPIVESTILMTTLGGMLGLGSMRTVEKVQGVDRQNLKAPPAPRRK
jgi:hypothetical protein